MGNPNTPAAMPGKTKRKDGILTVAELRDKLTKIIEDNPERADWPALTYSSVDEIGVKFHVSQMLLTSLI